MGELLGEPVKMAMDLRDQLQDTLGEAYILEQELSGGAMSRVFVATDAALGRKVVIKVLPPEMAAAVRVDRFRREIQLAANLQHPHIVPLLTAGETNGLPYYMMPFVRGESLRHRLTEEGELPIAEAIRILREVASALGYAHENGIVHRDIKPENVLISGGAAVVTDFGVAKALGSATIPGAGSMTGSGMVIGTPAYMAPEQAAGGAITDRRADIYALGVMGYEMLAGSSPFAATSAQAMIVAHLTQVPEPVSKRRATVPPALAQVIMRCLEKRPADRFQTGGELARELDAIQITSGAALPSRPSPIEAARRSFQRYTFPRKALATGILTVMLLAVWWVVRSRSDAGSVGPSYYPYGKHPGLAPAVATPPWIKDVEATVDAYARAIETRRVAEIQSVFPTLTADQLANWNLFFDQSRAIKVAFKLTEIAGTEDSAHVRVDGTYRITDLTGGTQTVPVHWTGSLRHADRRWRIVAVGDTVQHSR